MAGVLIKCPQERERYTGEGQPREDGGRDKSDEATSQGTPGFAVCPKQLGRSMEHSSSELSEKPSSASILLVAFLTSKTVRGYGGSRR